MTWEEALKHLTAMKICTKCEISGKSTFCDDCEWNYESGTLGDIAQALDIAIKTFDAVPVVRCKDCIHRPIGDPHEHDVKPPKEEDYKCPCLCQDDSWYSWIPDDDWFCGNGETE